MRSKTHLQGFSAHKFRIRQKECLSAEKSLPNVTPQTQIISKIQILRDPSKKGDVVAVKERVWKEIEERFNQDRPAEKRWPRKFLEGMLKVSLMVSLTNLCHT